MSDNLNESIDITDEEKEETAEGFETNAEAELLDENADNSSEEDEMNVLNEKIEELEDQTLRLQAEIANMNRRHRKEREDAAKYRSQSLASKLLEGLDNLERALGSDVSSEDAQALKQGVEMVYNQLLNAFEQENISVINPLNEVFDPNFHQAVSMVKAGEDQDSGLVVNVLQKGYLLNDRVIRPAMVIVSE